MCSREREKWNYQEHEKAIFLIYLSFRTTFLFCFEEMSYSLPMWHVTTALFVPVRKRSNSRSQIFCKIDALKNLAISTGKHLCWKFCFISLIKKRHQHRCFPVNIAKCLSTTFYIEYNPLIMLFRNVMWWWNSFGVFGHKIDIFHISWVIALFSFIIILLEVHWYFLLVFIPKFLLSVTFARIATMALSLFWLNC